MLKATSKKITEVCIGKLRRQRKLKKSEKD
jgi:hypothetical protein